MKHLLDHINIVNKDKMTSPKVITNKKVDTLLDKLLNIIKDANKPIVVCDKLFKCEKREKYYKCDPEMMEALESGMEFEICPWCGGKIWREE
jgi:hypothetical protein